MEDDEGFEFGICEIPNWEINFDQASIGSNWEMSGEDQDEFDNPVVFERWPVTGDDHEGTGFCVYSDDGDNSRPDFQDYPAMRYVYDHLENLDYKYSDTENFPATPRLLDPAQNQRSPYDYGGQSMEYTDCDCSIESANTWSSFCVPTVEVRQPVEEQFRTGSIRSDFQTTMNSHSHVNLGCNISARESHRGNPVGELEKKELRIQELSKQQ